jgi:tetratricopeptide (TPR) repeat protein
MNVHYGDDELSVYALAPSLSLDAEGIERHVAECDECSRRLHLIDELDDACRNEVMWAAFDLRRKRPQGLDAAKAEYRRIEKEDADAEALLTPLLKSPIRFRAANVDTDAHFHTGSVVRKLCLAAHSIHEKQPQFSLLITTSACRIALGLPKKSSERRAVLALAIRERANAFRYLGRFAEGLKALDDAERLFDQSPGTDPFDRAVVWHIRATIYFETDRPAEGLNLARAAAVVFHDYGDLSRELGAGLVEACCIHFSGRPSEAAEAFERVAAIARDAKDLHMLARALQNAGTSYLSAQQPEKAGTRLTEAVSLFDQLGLTTEHARSNWKLASVLVAEGQLNEGIAKLAQAQTDLRRLGLTNDAALATLEWAEARLATDLPEGVADACRGILVEFESEGMMRNARVALAYLHEALSTGTATPNVVRQVRTYLEDLPSRPSFAFVPVA